MDYKEFAQSWLARESLDMQWVIWGLTNSRAGNSANNLIMVCMGMPDNGNYPWDTADLENCLEALLACPPHSLTRARGLFLLWRDALAKKNPRAATIGTKNGFVNPSEPA